MSDSINALLGAQRSGSVLDAIAHPAQLNVLGAMQGAAQTAASIYDMRARQGQQAWGQYLLNSIDPATGQPDYQKAAAAAAASGDPNVAYAAPTMLARGSELTGQQIEQANARYGAYTRSAATVASDPSDANVDAALDNMAAAGWPRDQIEAERARIKLMSPADRVNYAIQHLNAGIDAQTSLNRQIGTTTVQDINGQSVPLRFVPASRPGEQGHWVVDQGYIGTDPRTGRRFYNPGAPAAAGGSATAPPPPSPGNLGTGRPPAGSPLLNQDKAAPPPQPATATAAPAAAPATNDITAQDAAASDKARAAAGEQPATPPPPAPGSTGAETHGLVVPKGATMPPPPAAPAAAPSTAPPGAPSASLLTPLGVQVASASPAFAPNALSPPGAPSPAVSGDVSAMLQGVANARTARAGGAPLPGPQVAQMPPGSVPLGLSAQEQFNIAHGPEQFQKEIDAGNTIRTQQATLANMLADTAQFSTGPLAGIVGRVRNYANAVGLPGVNVEAQSAKESFGKLAAGLANAQGAGSDSRMNVNIAANPHEELSPAGVDLVVRQLQGNADYLAARVKLAQKYPNRTDYQGFQDQAQDLDPRVFQLGRMTGDQRTVYWNALDSSAKAQVGAAIKRAKELGVLGQ